MRSSTDLTPAIDDLVWISHWITPVGESPRRFDTRFFVAVAPPGQTSQHDDNETIASEWVGPTRCLGSSRPRRTDDDAADDQEPRVRRRAPQRCGGDGDGSNARLGRRPILPRMRLDADGRIRGVSLPGDDDYDDLGTSS